MGSVLGLRSGAQSTVSISWIEQNGRVSGCFIDLERVFRDLQVETDDVMSDMKTTFIILTVYICILTYVVVKF